MSRIFLKGLATILPPALTLYVLYWLGTKAEAMFLSIWRLALPETYYLPGMGVALGFVLIFAIGLLMQSWLLDRLVGYVTRMMHRIPLVKSVYSAFEDVVDYITQDKDEKGQKVVCMDLLDGVRAIGFVTRDDYVRLKTFGAAKDDVLVYFPLSYQIGGHTLLVKTEKLTPLEISVEEAMRFVVTSGVVGEKKRS